MAILNLADYIQFAIENSTPQLHRSKWIKDEDNILHECISNNLSLIEISKIISLRSPAAICTRANKLGYGNKINKDDGRTYFNKEINHKNRRTKDEILEGREKVPIKQECFIVEHVKVDVDIIPQKVEISIHDLDDIIDKLIVLRGSHEQY